MSRVTFVNHVSLDGVMQAHRGRPDEDLRGGFAHGGTATVRLTDSVTTTTGVVIATYADGDA